MAAGVYTVHEWGNTCGAISLGIDYGIYEKSCDDGRDNDGDGHTDCFDRDCIFDPGCPSLVEPVDICGLCPGTDRNGVDGIFDDFADLNLADSISDYERIYLCTQIYEPYCDDADTRDFLDWMRDKGYLGRITAIHANDARDPVKRFTGTRANFEGYYQQRATPGMGSSAVDFRSISGPFPMEFVEVEASDTGIVNQLNSEADVQAFFVPYFEDQIYGRDITVSFRVHPLDYQNEFGPLSREACVTRGLCQTADPCPQPDGICCDQVCFQASASEMSDWAKETLDPNYQNHAGHVGVKELADGTQIFDYPLGQTVLQNHKVVTNRASLGSYAHEYGHSLGLPHPLATQSTIQENVANLIGTCGLMARPGYVMGCVERLEPLGRYVLEPVDGYKDETTFGPIYSLEVLNACEPANFGVTACPGGSDCTVTSQDGLVTVDLPSCAVPADDATLSVSGIEPGLGLCEDSDCVYGFSVDVTPAANLGPGCTATLTLRWDDTVLEDAGISASDLLVAKRLPGGSSFEPLTLPCGSPEEEGQCSGGCSVPEPLCVDAICCGFNREYTMTTESLSDFALLSRPCFTEVCHISPGNPDKARTIRINCSDVDDHIAHGDTEGACPPTRFTKGRK
jgi:hypothetical protein